ncbi:unnamed protein product [Phytophthora lilii]|uniref:glucan endo-1,3-beta-D-glucosidase n=1 Tax=Phytophthora lilii TaxID=2077276 RepID=A0A9W6WY92_9STRA|nr:unnamed protein product [Phytophthora lilii]
MKLSWWVRTAFAVAVTLKSTIASLDDPDVGEGFDFLHGTVESATEKLVDTLSPNTPPETTQQASASGGFFAPFATDAPSEELFQRNGSLAKLAPIINVAEEALHQPIPTNKWWGNLIHVTATNRSENYPAWANPYAVKLPKEAPFGLQTCYPYSYREMAPEVNGTVKWYTHGLHNDITLSAQEFFNSSKPNYEVYHWDDIGIQLRTCDKTNTSCMDSALVSGMAFVSATYDGLTPRIDTEHNITFVDDSAPGKFVIHLNNSQTWVLYASDKSLSLRVEESVVFSVNASGSSLVADTGYSGTIRVALLPEDAKDDTVYDEFAACMVRGGSVSMESRTGYSLHWDVEGDTCSTVGLLHFALPHQVESMSGSPTTTSSAGAIVMYSATRGRMVGQVTTTPTWTFVEPEADFEVDFYPARKPTPWVVQQTGMLRTLQKDIIANWSMNADSWYFNGKYFQKYASLCLMAADSSVVGPDTTLLTYCLEKLETMVEPMLNNTLSPPLAYETLYSGIVSSLIFNTGWLYMDFGSGIYNDHHYHFGYFVTASAILKHLDPNWSRMPELENIIWTMLRDVANPSLEDPYFPRFRHFSWYHGHSYSRGVTLLDNGKDEESTSEDINFYYGMTLWGKVTGHKAVEDLGSLMLRLNAHAIRTYFLLKSDNIVHPPEIVRNHVTGIFFDNKVYYNTWFLDEKYAIHGIQMLPVSPINELARTSEFVEQEWNDIGDFNTPFEFLLRARATTDPLQPEASRRCP